MQNREEWLRGRKHYLGGSDIASILGLNQYRSALDVFLDKTSTSIKDESSNFTKWGTILEDVIANEYAATLALEIEPEESPIFHFEYSFLAANIDRWVDNRKYILECKTTSAFKANEWGEEGTDQIPESYLCQVAWYSAICNVAKVDIAVLIGGNDFRIYTYNKNKEFEDKLIKIGCDFWQNNVQKNVPPKCSNIHDISNLYPKSNGVGKKVNRKIENKLQQLKLVKEESKMLEDKVNKLKLEIQEYMQDYDVLVNDSGEIVASWKNTSPRAFLDLKRLKQDCQDIYLKYVNYAKQSRIFLVK